MFFCILVDDIFWFQIRYAINFMVLGSLWFILPNLVQELTQCFFQTGARSVSQSV